MLMVFAVMAPMSLAGPSAVAQTPTARLDADTCSVVVNMVFVPNATLVSTALRAGLVGRVVDVEPLV